MFVHPGWRLPSVVLGLLLIVLMVLPAKAQRGASPRDKVYSVVIETISRMQREGIQTSRPLLPDERHRFSSLLTPLDASGRIGLILDVASMPANLPDRLSALGAEVLLLLPSAKTISLFAPIDQIDAIASMDEVSIVRPMIGGIKNTGSVTSEGDGVHHALNVRTDLHVQGDSVNVGVISDGCTTWMAPALSGDLPPAFGPPNFTFANGNKMGSGDEGTAMMEIVYDLAPQASLYYYGALGMGGGSPTMVDAIQRLVREKKCKVIVDDLTYFDQPMFEDGTPTTAWTIAAAAKWAIDTGVVYISSAGNYAAGGITDRSHYQSTFADIQPASNTPGPKPLPNGPIPIPPPPPPVPNSFDDIHDFDPTPGFDPGLMVVIPPYTGIGEPPKLYVILQWNDPWGLSADDYDLYLYDARMVTLLTSSVGVQAGAQNPYESVWYYNYGATPETVNVVINHFAPPGAMPKLLGLYISGCSYVERHTAENSIWGQPGVPDVIAVGAVPSNNITVIEDFSSRGNYNVYFPLFQSREKPDVVAVDGVSITHAGGFPPGGGPFFGTSAAAPHMAGMAALLLSRCPTMAPAAVHSKFERTTIDLGAPGFDPTFGNGRADIERAMLELDLAIGSHGPYSMSVAPAVPMFFATPDGYASSTVTITAGMWPPFTIGSTVSVTAGNPYTGAGVRDPGCPTVKRWYQLTAGGGIPNMYSAHVTAYVDNSECLAAGVDPNNLQILHWNGAFFDIMPGVVANSEVGSTWRVKGSMAVGDFSPFFVGILTRDLDAATVASSSGKNDSSTTVEFSVENKGNGWDTLTVHLRDSRGWTFAPTDSAWSLDAGQKSSLVITVHISATDTVGSIDSLWLIAHSVSDPSYIDSTLATVTIVATTVSAKCSVRDGWNMVSVPLHIVDPRKEVVYPGASSPAYTYHGGYMAYDSVMHCVGYWLKFSGGHEITITGMDCHVETLTVWKGWNMIGSTGHGLRVGDIGSIPGGIVSSNFFGYDSAYYTTDSIRPGSGYWVKVGQNGKLVLSSSGMTPSENRIRILETDEMPPPPPSEDLTRDDGKPASYGLYENFPNPFNPSTVIRYQLPFESKVVMKIYNILGQEVAVLVDGLKQAGYHEVRFVGGNLAGGIYFCRFTAGPFQTMAKMLLVK